MMPDQNNQKALLKLMHNDGQHPLTSCQWLERRFVHAENRFLYSCNEQDDGDGCPKSGSGRKGVADKSCLTDPYENKMGSWVLSGDNNEQDDFAEK